MISLHPLFMDCKAIREGGRCKNLRFLPEFEAEPQRFPVSSILCPRFTTAMLTQMSASATA